MDTLSKLEKSLILTLIGLILSFGVTYGRMAYQVSDQARDIANLQSRVDKISQVATIMQYTLMYGKGVKK